jgi:hypothetical protein
MGSVAGRKSMAESLVHALRSSRRLMICVPNPPHPPVTSTWPRFVVDVVLRPILLVGADIVNVCVMCDRGRR